MKIVKILLALALCPFLAEARAEEPIRTLKEVNAFLSDTTPRKTPLEVTGTVLSVFTTPKTCITILQDESGARAEFHRFPGPDQPAPGDRIRAVGKAFMGNDLEYYVHVSDYTVLGKGPSPEPVDVKLSETSPKKNHLMKIRTEGVVMDAVPDELDGRYMILLLKDEEVVVPVSLPLDLFGDRSDLIDARIRVTGTYRKSVNGVRKYSWPNIQPFGPDDIEILTPPPQDPFALPPLENRLYLSPEDVVRMSKRSVAGEVLATWSGNRTMVRTEDGRIVNLELTTDEPLPRCGEPILAAGQPETDLFRINLTAVRWKPLDRRFPAETNAASEISSAPLFWNVNGRSGLNALAHGRLLFVRGILRTLPSPGDADLRFVVDSGTVSVPVDVTANPAALDGLVIGSEIRVTGRCLLLTDAWRPDRSFPQAKGFALVIRAPEDVVVLRRPPWWTPARLLVVIAVLLTALAGIGIRTLVRRHFERMKIAERTRLAVELHDSLSQNLAGIACQVSAGNMAIFTQPETAKTRIDTAERMLESCRTELKNCLFDLRSNVLEEPAFDSAVRMLLEQFSDQAEISVRFAVRRNLFPDTVAHAILAIIRELAGNGIRHGQATAVKVAGCVDKGRLLFSVTDNGSGFDPKHRPGLADGHFGLDGIRDRLKRLKGTLSLESVPGKGTKAVVTLPIKP